MDELDDEMDELDDEMDALDEDMDELDAASAVIASMRLADEHPALARKNPENYAQLFGFWYLRKWK